MQILDRAPAPHFPNSLTTAWRYCNDRVEHLQALGNAIPPSSLVLLSCVAVQVGSATAKSLFDSIGSIGAALVCKSFAAVLLLLLSRPTWRQYHPRDYAIAGLLGLVIAGMSLAFFGAIARIPLGTASALEFLGPLSVAIVGSRRWLDWLWVVLAGLGVLLLSPLHHAGLDPIGVALALTSAACWAGYIVVSAQVGQVFPGKTGLAIALLVASLLLLIPGGMQGGAGLLHPTVWAIGLLAALLSTLVPYSLEYAALKRMPPRVFGVLMSVEPAIAALVGLLLLGERLAWTTLVAITLITSAAIGATLLGRRP